MLRVNGSDVAARSRNTRSWSAASSTTSHVAVRPINSGRVNADCAGPRRAAITTSRTLRPAQRRQRVIGDVGAGQCRRDRPVRMRATSRATLPLPMTTTRSWLRSTGRSAKSGWPLIQATISVAVPLPGRSDAVDVEPTVVRCTDGVDHGVMVCQQLGVTDVRADLDVEIEPESGQPRHSIEHPGDPLGALVIRRHARAHQPVGRRQLLEDVDPHAGLRQQFVGGVHRGRPGPDDRHRQRDRPNADGSSGHRALAPAWTSAGASSSRFG